MEKTEELKIPQELKEFLGKLREDCMGFSDYIPPTKNAIEELRESIEVLKNSFEDKSLCPFIFEAVRKRQAPLSEDQLANIPYALDVLAEALAINDAPERRGRKHLPLWMSMAADEMIKQYESVDGQKAKCYYKLDDVNDPGNDFTKWFQTTMLNLFPGDITSSNCKTLLEKKLG